MNARSLAVLGLAWMCALPTRALADSDDPYAYDLRFALFPAFFQAGVSQSHFGSAVRAEADFVRGFSIEAAGRLPWLNLLGEKEPRGFTVHAGILWHFVDDRVREQLAGTVYPADPGMMRGGGSSGTDTDLDVPTSQKLGGPRLTLPERDESLVAEVRVVHSLRLGWDFVRAVEKARPLADDDVDRFALNTIHALYLGYAWGAHWNLSPGAAGGERAIGWRRFFLDVVLAPAELTDVKRLYTPLSGIPSKIPFFPLGARLGMQGAINALARGARGLGFAYSIEIGSLPGASGFEAYLFLGFGLEVDAVTRRRQR